MEKDYLTLAFGHHEDRNTRLCRDARGCDGCVRKELAAGMKAHDPQARH
jgi:hypothetical protein